MATLPKGCREALAHASNDYICIIRNICMKTYTTASIRRSLLAVGILGLTAITSHAAVVTWGAAQSITGDSNVSTAGSLAYAVNLGGANTTVNGVTFQGLAGIPFGNQVFIAGNLEVSGFFFNGASDTGSAAAPFSSLSAGYRSLLGSAVAVGGTMTMKMSGLTLGENYEFQAWVNGSGSQPGFTFKVDVAAGNSVTLDPNLTLAAGGLGQYVIGSFTADALTQQITFTNDEVAVINGFQLRLLAAPVGVIPEPGSTLAGLMALGVCLSGLGRRSRRQSAAV